MTDICTDNPYKKGLFVYLIRVGFGDNVHVRSSFIVPFGKFLFSLILTLLFHFMLPH